MTEIWAETHEPHNFLILSSEKFTQDPYKCDNTIAQISKKESQTIDNANHY